MFVSKHQKDWDVFIPAALMVFRTSTNESTGESPFYLLYGREPLLPMDVSLLPPTDPASSIAEHRRRIVKQIEVAQQIAKENIMRTQQKMKAYYDKRSSEPNFIEGQRCWVYTPKSKKGLSKKLLHNFHGPYRVVEKLSPVHYRLRTCSNKPVTSIVHANRMKHFVDPNDGPIEPPSETGDNMPFLTINNPSLETQGDTATETADEESAALIDNETVFNAEALLDKRIANGAIQYLVKWAGFPRAQATWEPAEHILDNRLINDFEKRQSHTQ